MQSIRPSVICIIFILLILSTSVSFSQDTKKSFSDYTFTQQASIINGVHSLSNDFQGYTSHWDRFSWTWHSYNGVFIVSQPSVESEIWKLEMDIGNQLLLDELWIQDGFVTHLANRTLPILKSPSHDEINTHLPNTDIVIIGLDQNPLINELIQKIPQDLQFRRNRAFYVQSDQRTIFVIASHTLAEVERLTHHIENAKFIIEKYNLSKGLAGVHSNYLLITPGLPHNPFNLINKTMQISCSWIMVSGYNDWLIPDKINPSLNEINFPFTFLPGQYVNGGVMYGMRQYPNIQNNTVEECLDWKEEKKGYYFSNLNNIKINPNKRFDGYVVTDPTDQVRIDSLDMPIITNAGTISQTVPPAMILFHNKNIEPTEKNIWQAILNKKAVAVFANGHLLGPKELVDPLKILMLEKQFLREQFVNQITLQASLNKKELNITLRNKSAKPVSGTLEFQVAPDITIGENSGPLSITLAPFELKTLKFSLNCTPAACGRDLPVGILFESPERQVRALTHFEVPFPVEMHPLIFDQPGMIHYPVTLYNYSDRDPTVELKIYSKQKNEIIYEDQKTIPVSKWEKVIAGFDFSLEEGEYNVYVSTLGVKKKSKISIKSQTGSVKVSEDDFNGDGIPEIIIENSYIKVTLLLFGGRVIEYIVKNRDENLLFKLWPKKPPWAGTPRGVRAFYPWGGLEEFTGYPYIGGHIVFKYEILEASGTRGRVRLWANIHGSKIEKIISLYGDSELLEVRYAMNDIVPGITVIGINPLIEIGPSTGPEDVYYFPAEKLEERRPETGRYYGDMFFLKEGWVAGYDTEMDISLIVGYPVNDAMFMHLWNNHPNNTPTPYYYTELQPWLIIKPETTTYFSYYLFGQNGDWKTALEKFKQLGLVTRVEKRD